MSPFSSRKCLDLHIIGIVIMFGNVIEFTTLYYFLHLENPYPVADGHDHLLVFDSVLRTP